jgi:hypothetical protein
MGTPPKIARERSREQGFILHECPRISWLKSWLKSLDSGLRLRHGYANLR